MKFMFTQHCDKMASAMSSYMNALGIPRSLHGFEYVKIQPNNKRNPTFRKFDGSFYTKEDFKHISSFQC